MSNNLIQQYVTHLNSIVQWFENALEGTPSQVPERAAYGIIVRAKTAVEKISGKQSYYFQQIEEIISSVSHISYRAELVIGVVEALKGDLLDGSITSLTDLIHGKIFNNYLYMAEYLLQEGYKDAAAVIAGSTLEEQLRQLCLKNNIDIEISSSDGSKRPKKAQQMNQDLGKQAYSLFDQQQITTWLKLRNSAAHGQYTEYTENQVAQFINWLHDFMSRCSA